MPTLQFADPTGALVAVRLVTELWKRSPPRPFARKEGGWELDLEDDLPVDRLEYALELEHPDGARARVTDPTAPTTDAPFGGTSVLVLPGYRAPAWLDVDAPPGEVTPLALPTAHLGAPLTGQLWSAAGLAPGTPAPLLVVHDGPEYARYAALDRFLAAGVTTGALPPLRAALLAPGARSEDYAASDAYADALVRDALPALAALAPSPRSPVGLGASLGALALLHAHRRHPGAFGGLALQSGSFFRRDLDGQEAGFARFARIEACVRAIAETAAWPHPIPVAITCGTGEENLANNRAMARALAAQGYPVIAREVRDGHTWTCWRDALAAALPPLLAGGA